jgi:hypothetical protein
MKPKYFLISTSCIFIILLSTSCKKDSSIAGQLPCNSCGIIPVGVGQDTTIYINDSIWERENEDEYVSDISSFLNQFNSSPSKVSQMSIVSGPSILNIFPNTQESFMKGTIYGTVLSLDNKESCGITFIYLDKDKHDGETPNGGKLPFSSLEIEIVCRK